ncbi:MAG: ribonuclease HII [Bacteroidales bacterium]|nr:ribonuclease HII [Bacteroidales bacterium]
MLKSCYQSDCVEAGCDEAGRGCLAGPVSAAAVILPPDYRNELLNDSKQISEKNRYKLREIIEKDAICYAVAFIDNIEIDQINILKASIKAMHKALDELELEPQHIIIDGNRFYPYKNIAHKTIVKGDSKYLSIAAASVLAKTYRDDYMLNLSENFPEYNWTTNKGYPTKKHRKAIQEYGVTKYHRKTFQLLDKQLEIDF